MQITDPVFVRKETHSALDRFALRFIRDERDLPFIHLSVTASLVLFPLAALLFAAEPFRWWYAPIYWAILLGFFFDRYILMLHNTGPSAVSRPRPTSRTTWACTMPRTTCTTT